VSDPILDRIDRYVEEGEFSVPEPAGTSYDLCMAQGKAPSLLLFLLNDLEIFELARAIAGCGWIGSFDGHLRRMMRRATHGEPWHGEIFGSDRVGMSIDLSSAPYSGGVARDSRCYSRQVLHRGCRLRARRRGAVSARLDPAAPGHAGRGRLSSDRLRREVQVGHSLRARRTPRVRPSIRG
jgi:hypothetical protein